MQAPQMIRVILVDDHPHVHRAVNIALDAVDDITLVAQCGNGQELLLLCAEHKPDIVLMDVMMPVMDGIEATRRLHQHHPEIKILVLSSFQDDESIHRMLENGAMGYVLKGALATDLVNVIRTAYSGKSVFSTEIIQMLLNPAIDTLRNAHSFGLTPRELEILQYIVKGNSNGEIAVNLAISLSTVKFHISNVLHKMEVETRAEAVALAVKNQLI